MIESGSFRFSLGPREDGKYHKVTAVGMENVTAGFGDSLQEAQEQV